MAGLAALLLLACFSVTARAEVAVTFYSHDFGKNFPHAFFVAKGELADGKKIDTAFGFTAVNVTPGILFGSKAMSMDRRQNISPRATRISPSRSTMADMAN